jgi:hypothetical protein
MTTITVAMLTIGLAASGVAHAKTNSVDEARTIAVCIRTATVVNFTDLARAKYISTQIMATAGVSLQWIECAPSASKETADAVISLTNDSPPNDHPGALAYALPFEGSRIVVMANRLAFAGAGVFPVLLGHVMSHELAHLLQGIATHSEQGIMKSQWTALDFGQMLWRPMCFSAVDAERIQTGLQARRHARDGAGLHTTKAGE